MDVFIILSLIYDSDFFITLITKLIYEKILLLRSKDAQSIDIDYVLIEQCLSSLMCKSIPSVTIPPWQSPGKFFKLSNPVPRSLINIYKGKGKGTKSNISNLFVYFLSSISYLLHS